MTMSQYDTCQSWPNYIEYGHDDIGGNLQKVNWLYYEKNKFKFGVKYKDEKYAWKTKRIT